LLDDQKLGRKEPNMMLIGVDYHPSFQQIAFFVAISGLLDQVSDDEEEAGECGELQLNHSEGEAE
jgi:hypothetical protein